MIPSISALLKTVTGKVLAGVIVATMGVGAAAAAGADVSPSLIVGEDDGVGDDEEADDPDDEGSDDGDDEGSDDEGSDDEGSDDEGDGDDSDEGSDDEGDGDDGDGEESDLDEDRDEAADNHGQVVSEFTQSAAELGLTGCAKGQATAAVARGDVDPSLPSLMDDLAPYIAKCGTDVGVDVESEDDPDAADGDEPADWKTTRDEGKLIVQEAQAAFDELCGDDDDDTDGSDGSGDVAGVDDGADSDDGDEPMSEECRVLKQAAKDARNAWKAEWKGERDAEHDARKEARPASKQEQQAAKAEAKQDKGNQGQKHDKSDKGRSADAPGKNK